MSYKTSQRSFFQRLLGKPITTAPANAACWQVDGTQVLVDLDRATELGVPYGAICLDGETLPTKLLVMRDEQGEYRAFENKCAHGGRGLDPVPGTETVCCCSMGKSIFDYDGQVLAGGAKGPIQVFPVSQAGSQLTIDLN